MVGDMLVTYLTPAVASHGHSNGGIAQVNNYRSKRTLRRTFVDSS